MPFTFWRVPWNTRAERELADTWYGPEGKAKVVTGVQSGAMDLYRVNGDSWMVVQSLFGKKMLFIWCYQGRRLVQLIDALLPICLAQGVEQISFFTFHVGVIRALRRYSVYGFPTRIAGECQYVIDVRPAMDARLAA